MMILVPLLACSPVEIWLHDGVGDTGFADDDADDDSDDDSDPHDSGDPDDTGDGPEEWDVSDVADGMLLGGWDDLALGDAESLVLGGDVTGDGIGDVMVSGGRDGDGVVWVVSGQDAMGTPADVSAVATASFYGAGGYPIGTLAGTMRDVTGEGDDDLLIASGQEVSGFGYAWLLAGGDDLEGTLDGRDAVKFFSGDSEEDRLRIAVAGDIDGDSVAEVVTGAPDDDYVDGESYAAQTGNVAIFQSGWDTEYWRLLGDAEAQIHGAEEADHLGQSLAIADLDGDGYDDILAGAPGADTEAEEGGAVYLFTGNTALEWEATADEAMWARVAGTTVSQALGEDPLAAPGDTDGDGHLDLALPSSAAGTISLWWQADQLAGDVSLSSADLVFVGTPGEFPSAAAWSADRDADGVDDAVLGDRAAGDSGLVYLFDLSLRPGPTLGPSDSTVHIAGAHPGDALGSALAAGADVDGDGTGDLLLGAPGADDLAADGGAVYVLAGR